jgi:hypothetical protein
MAYDFGKGADLSSLPENARTARAQRDAEQAAELQARLDERNERDRQRDEANAKAVAALHGQGRHRH